ncbi:hypothetical protein HYPSUDRAFT_862747 [Hypholoma sublateritium FD-334 SS-4]|uniref:Heterokaryon incompatibility domain-containing protein n=1 Tax=Hypholoma sublateritium (strain FD-334 SS-4) TaxID=945553 RepID=A0A0D2Q742_HYPSF|nr:hypothetical protein HYPSUDRAFT_862747 [Hypholoma sublateritium FD-334 SS-4]
MPIRVLAFDSTGSDLQHIDRTEIYSHVLQKVCAEAMQPQFQAAWKEIVGLSGNPLVPNALSGYFERTAREKKIITELVERHSRYAILSHTWIRDVPGDVIYQGWNTRERYPAGYRKVAYFCAVAAQAHGVGFGWMDNVCINKDSSSELDESIRSMYKWYRGAHVCISFLSQSWDLSGMKDDSWFTRGWTLQELLAPRDNYFYNGNWEYLGSSTDEAIQSAIESASTITRAELEACRRGETDRIPISRRLQLAAKRQVTREEDMAYSLMGLLGVDISVAYGEGTEHAFFRLVREMLSTKKDVLDIFNHGYYPSRKIIPATIDNYRIRSTTIYTPDFEGKLQQSQWQPPSEPIVLTHLGVRIPLLLVHALKVDRFDAQCVPVGDLCGSIQMSLSAAYMHYSVLDKRIYVNGLTTGGESDTSGVPLVATLGVLNFGAIDDNILLPRNCLFVPLDCGQIKPGTVRPYDNVKILDASGSVFAGLTFDEHVKLIARQNLARHGVQLITLHL